MFFFLKNNRLRVASYGYKPSTIRDDPPGRVSSTGLPRVSRQCSAIGGVNSALCPTGYTLKAVISQKNIFNGIYLGKL